MRCPHCGHENEEGAAFCRSCRTALTAYGGQVTGEVSERTRQKAARLAIRPWIVPAMTVYCGLAGTAALWVLFSAFAARTRINEQGTNYLGAAFGAIGLAFFAALLLPIAVGFFLSAWAAWTQRTWGWYAGAAALVLGALAALSGWTPGGAALRVAIVILSAGLAAFWLSRTTREWYGAA